MTSRLFSFLLQSNSKKPSNEWVKNKYGKHTNRIKWRQRTALELAKQNCGFACGKLNDITLIDYDFYVKDTDVNPYNKDTCIFRKKFGEVLDYAKKNNILCIQTPSGGFHMYFKYDPSIKQTSQKSCHIDVRNDGGYIVAPYSKIDGKQYKIIHDGEIKECPEELKTFMIDIVMNKQKVKRMLIRNNSNNKQTQMERLEVDLDLYTFDFPEELLIQVIEALPIHYFTEYEDWLKFTTAMKTIDRQDLWDKYSKIYGGVSYDDIKNLETWEGIKDHNILLCVNHILHQAQGNGMPNARSLLDYYKYKDIPQNQTKATDIINRPKLGYDIFNDIDDKLIVVKSDTGTGKTTSFKSFVKELNLPFISSVSRVSLGKEQTRVFRLDGIECYFHQEITDEIQQNCMNGWYNYEGKNVIINIDSLLKMNNWSDFQGYTLYMDEFNSKLEYLITADLKTLSKNRVSIYELLKKIIHQADRVIMTDADINDISFDFIKTIMNEDPSISMKYIENQYKHNDGRKAEEMIDYEIFRREVLSLSKVMICSDIKGKIDCLSSEYEKIGKEHLVYTSEGYEHFKDGVRIKQKGIPSLDMCEIVLFSPAVVYGLDSVMERPVYALFSGETISPEAMNQQINRNRNITFLKFIFENKNWRSYKYVNQEEAYLDLTETENYGSNIKRVVYDEYTKKDINIQNEGFLRLYSKYLHRRDCYKTNPFAHFIKILEKNGWDVNCYYEKTKDIDLREQRIQIENKKYRATMKQVEQYTTILEKKIGEQYEHRSQVDKLYEEIEPVKYFNIDVEKIFTIKKHHKWLVLDCKIPPQNWHEFPDLVKKPEVYTTYTNYSRYFYNDRDDIISMMDKNKDFYVKQIEGINNKLLFLMKVKQLCKIKNKSDIMAKVGLSESDGEKIYIEYVSLFRCQRDKKKFNLTDVKDCSRLVFNMYKQLFGDCCEAKRSRVGGVSRQMYCMKKKYVEYQDSIRAYKNQYNIRNKRYEKYVENMPCQIED
tara:strand:- start:746 stop:3730 length:2985 start_codon:yes stop_codon:yes gene_type:complete